MNPLLNAQHPQPTMPKYKPAIATMSLGRTYSGHSLPHKLSCAAAKGFVGIELFYEDLEHVARDLPGGLTNANQINAARLIKGWCDERGLEILCLQPFMHYEGLRDREEHERRLEKLKLWFEICAVLGTDIIQIPSCFLPEKKCSDDRELIVGDLREVADLGLRQDPPIRFVYESLCWATYVDLWEDCWDIVAKVDRPNFGICLDTFNIAGRIWGDPAHPSGKTPNADEDLKKSLERMRKTIDVSKIFYVEVVDAERLERPLLADHPWHRDGQKPRMSWSRNARLFPFEDKAYLPVIEILRTIIEDVGFEGWVSFEFFSRTMAEAHQTVPEEHARRAGESWVKLCKEMGWDVDAEYVFLSSTDRAWADNSDRQSAPPSPDSSKATPQTFARL
jgi:4-hydroxyphenylpyruvate dioxygenase